MPVFTTFLIVTISIIVISTIGMIITGKVKGTDNNPLFNFFGSVICFFLIMGPIACGGTYMVESEYTDSYNKLVYEIYSLKGNDSETNGWFIIGCGIMKETSYYVYYAKTDKGLHLEKTTTSNTYIVETDAKVPSLYKVKEKGKEYRDEYFTLYVPTNTVRQEFNF